jgi:hypothetical protein
MAPIIANLRRKDAKKTSFVLRASDLLLTEVAAFFRRLGALLLILIMFDMCVEGL